MLEVLIVGGDDAECSALVETLEQCLGNCSTYEWLGSATELVNKNKRVLVAVTECVFHVEQVARVGTQVVLDALLVANVDEQIAEYTCLAALVHRDEKTALQHILQQTGSLKAHRLTAGVRTRDE